MNATYKVETFNLKANNGRHVRKATRVTRVSDGARVSFNEKLSKQSAISQAERLWSSGYHE